MNELEKYEIYRNKINQQLAFVGYKLGKNGKYHIISKASTIEEAKARAENLKLKLENRRIHPIIIQYCNAELLQNNYFHSVLEAYKSILHRIKELADRDSDGIALIEEVFSDHPILIINNYITPSEKNEHIGFKNLLKGLCSMFLNTTAHEPKIEWSMSEDDAIDILTIISYCHRRLDMVQKIR